jgi:simple sugar transport system permease protein
MLLAILAGALVGLINGMLVVRIGLQSMMATIGMKFLLLGLVAGGSNIIPIPLTFLVNTPFYNTFVGKIGNFPVQMIWAVMGLVIAMLLFNYHKFGSQISCVGDNLESSREMGINVATIKILAFVYVGIASAIVAVQSTLTNQIFYPGSGDGLLLIVLAAVFIGGTPSWGGIGTIMGSVIGACIIGVINSGIVAAGVSYLFKEFFYGLIIILALISHKLNGKRC